MFSAARGPRCEPRGGLTAWRRSRYSGAMPRSARAPLALLCLPALLGTPAALAAQSKSALSWVREPGAERCIGTVELGRRVERLVGPMLVSAPEGQVSVEGRIAPAPSPHGRGFVAEITIADAGGTILGARQLKSESDDCRAIDDELAFVIAVAIDPNAALAELPGELSQEDDPAASLLAELKAQPAMTAAGVAAAASVPAAAPARKPPRSAREPGPPLQVRAALEPALGLGNLPGPGAGVLLGVGIAFGDLAFWLRGQGWLPQEDVARGDARVRIGSFGLALAVCPLGLRSGRWSGALCAGAGVDRLTADPIDFVQPMPQRRWVFGPDLELRAGLEPGPAWWLGLSAVAQSRWPRQELGYELDQPDAGLQPVYRTPLASARLAAVVELRF
jgi:hypothetical protein